MNGSFFEDQATAARVEALAGYGIMDTEAEESFDQLTRIAASICGTPLAAVTLLDEKRQWLKSRIGIGVAETLIEVSFCAHAIRQPRQVMVVKDAREDTRFRDNPLVTGEPRIRFYAGAPIVTPSGISLGAVCAIDSKIREFNSLQEEALRYLADRAIELLEQRRSASTESTSNSIDRRASQTACPTCGGSLAKHHGATHSLH